MDGRSRLYRMSRHGTILPKPDDDLIDRFIASYPELAGTGHPYPRSLWLGGMEVLLRSHYPLASSRDLNVTARSLAPFPLRERDANRT